VRPVCQTINVIQRADGSCLYHLASVVDDEAMARRRVQRLLSALPGVSVVGELSDGVDVPARVEAGDVDLVLLDIEMRELSGLDALRLMPTGGPLVVFVTAHAEHALAAFDGGALDYVLKPVDPARLKTALERAKERLGARRAAPEGPAPSGPDDRLAVPTRRGLVVLGTELGGSMPGTFEGTVTLEATLAGRVPMATEPFGTSNAARASGARKRKVANSPSSRRSRSSPRPSTWPETKWPPSRVSARKLRSKLTKSPVFSPPRVVFARDSGETSKETTELANFVTDRQAPEVQMESPSATSAANGPISTRISTPAVAGWVETTSPRPSTRPVNMGASLKGRNKGV